jgi:hypothetical protein
MRRKQDPNGMTDTRGKILFCRLSLKAMVHILYQSGGNGHDGELFNVTFTRKYTEKKLPRQDSSILPGPY